MNSFCPAAVLVSVGREERWKEAQQSLLLPPHLQHCTYMKLPTLHAIEKSLKRGRKINHSHLKSTPVFLLYGGASFAWDHAGMAIRAEV